MDLTVENIERAFYRDAPPEFIQCIRAARKAVDAFDRQEGRCCRLPQSIMSALVCGLRNPETNAHYEALAMLETLVLEELNAYTIRRNN